MADSTYLYNVDAMDVVAFGAHPDDVELSAGGTLAKMASEGKRCAVVDLTRGELGTRGSAELRAQEAVASSHILGLVHRENLGLADGFFDINDESLMKVVSAIRRLRPAVVLANALADRHPDHGRGAELVARAAFLAGLPKVVTGGPGTPEPAWRPVPFTTTSRTTTDNPMWWWTSRSFGHQIRGHSRVQFSIPRPSIHGTGHADQQPRVLGSRPRTGDVDGAPRGICPRRRI